VAYSWSKAAAQPCQVSRHKPRMGTVCPAGRKPRKTRKPRRCPGSERWSFRSNIVKQLEAAVFDSTYYAPWYQALFWLAKSALRAAAAQGVDHTIAEGILEPVMLAWVKVYRSRRFDQEFTNSGARDEWAAIWKRWVPESADDPFVRARDPAIWPTLDDEGDEEPDESLRHLVAIVTLLGRRSETFTLTRRRVAAELGMVHANDGSRAIARLVSWGFLVPTGRTVKRSPEYRIGPRLKCYI